jgi:sulfite exporter TauE/SafE
VSLRGDDEGSYFVIGGIVVSAFAALGDVLKPKSFAGLFGAVPSIALATLGLTIAANGKMHAATEARSMIAGALVFLFKAW